MGWCVTVCSLLILLSCTGQHSVYIMTPSFDSWLSIKLQDLKTDEGVFGSYIKGILEGDETEDEKTEALEATIAGITNDCINQHVTEILRAWAKWRPAEDAEDDNGPKEDVDVRLARMLESQSLATMSHKSHHTEEDKRIKEAILAQYSQMSDEEESDAEGDEEGGSYGCTGSVSGLEKNTNAATIAQAERERRERAKLESMRKKEKDKEDREKQKALKEEKKEKRKTQKGERRR
ncbi:coiled-coil domain-containing protein 43 isoform X1 [Copidosoma floridanum]|uniref:coiled-coil domain-containing protein 43 isoform X1 n=1 Tax=Copidosoma floridanum TaxID=29053 RepID=UPI0006C93F58|nr:coiled-coil domain-containing protein 43 isoform X1 [Copidosoma floridanum]